MRLHPRVHTVHRAAVLCVKLRRAEEATPLLIKSIERCDANWMAWLLLAQHVVDLDQVYNVHAFARMKCRVAYCAADGCAGLAWRRDALSRLLQGSLLGIPTAV